MQERTSENHSNNLYFSRILSSHTLFNLHLIFFRAVECRCGGKWNWSKFWLWIQKGLFLKQKVLVVMDCILEINLFHKYILFIEFRFRKPLNDSIMLFTLFRKGFIHISFVDWYCYVCNLWLNKFIVDTVFTFLNHWNFSDLPEINIPICWFIWIWT